MTSELICQRCGACCRWQGYVKITEEEAGEMAEYLGIDRDEFMAKYTRMVFYPIGLTLRERSDDSCVFLVGNECVVQEVKPQHCRDFPNIWNFPGFQDVCRARPVEIEVPDDGPPEEEALEQAGPAESCDPEGVNE
jgi:Fe-S-cluster containining protein